MKPSYAILLALLLSSRLDAATITNLADGNILTVSNANKFVPPGYIVVVPPPTNGGTNYFITSFSLTNTLDWRFDTNTTWVDEIPARGAAWFVFPNPGAVSNGLTMSIANVRFCGGTTNTSMGQYALVCGFNGRRFTQCTFDGLYDYDAIISYNVQRSCIDHNVFHCTHGFGIEFYGLLPYGDTNWALPYTPDDGTNGEVVEYNVDNGTHRGFTDSSAGYVATIRENLIIDDYISSHGTESGAPIRSGRCLAIYLNTFTNTTSFSDMLDFRGGTCLVWSNNCYTLNVIILATLNRCAQAYSIWGGADGTNSWDTNDGTIYISQTVNTNDGLNVNGETTLYVTNAGWTVFQWGNYTLKNLTSGRFAAIANNNSNSMTFVPGQALGAMTFTNGDQFQVRKVIRRLDDVGLGQGDLVNDNGTTAYNTVTGVASTLRQAVDTCYLWGNSINGVVADATKYSWQSDMYSGTNYVVNSPRPGWVASLDPNPLDVTLSPTTPTNTVTATGGQYWGLAKPL